MQNKSGNHYWTEHCRQRFYATRVQILMFILIMESHHNQLILSVYTLSRDQEFVSCLSYVSAAASKCCSSRPSIPLIPLCRFPQLRAGLSADVVPGGKPGPRRTKTLVMADAVGPSLQRKGDLLANQDTCLSALRGDYIFM